MSVPFTISVGGQFDDFTWIYSIIAASGTLFQIYDYLAVPPTAESINLKTWGLYWTSSLWWVLYACEESRQDFGLFVASFVGLVFYLTVFLIGVRARVALAPVLKEAIEEYERRRDDIVEAGETLFRRHERFV